MQSENLISLIDTYKSLKHIANIRNKDFDNPILKKEYDDFSIKYEEQYKKLNTEEKIDFNYGVNHELY